MLQHSSIAVAWFTLTVIGDWLMFRKAGRAGILSVIPVVNMLVEFSICWRGWYGVLYCLLLIGVFACAVMGMGMGSSAAIGLSVVLVLLVFIIHWIESRKLSASFGKGFGFALFLFFFGRLARVILGLGRSRYYGRH